MCYIDKRDRMANSYSMNCRTWKWTKKLFFHVFDLTILNSHILFSSLVGKKISHRFSEYPTVEFIGTGWAWTECAKASRKTAYHSHSSPQTWRTWQKTLAYSVCHPKKMCMFGQKCFNDMRKVWCSSVLWYHMLSGLPHQGKSLKHSGYSLCKIGASAGNVRKRNFKF
jgi:hypothetical protein